MAGTINGTTRQAKGAMLATRKMAHRLPSASPRSQLDWRDATGMGTILFQPAFQAGRRA